MNAPRTLGIGPVRAPIAVLVCAALAAVFLVVACVRVDPATLRAVALIVGAFMFGAAIAGLVARAGTAPVLGALVAIGAAWLVTQRSDAGTLAVLAGMLGAGLALVCAPFGRAAEGWGSPRTIGVVLVIAAVVTGCYIGAETPTVHWFGGGVTHGPTTARQVALTFDDGPNVTATLPIMDILDRAGVTATFFEVGRAIDQDPQITQTLFEHGQLLGNHSYHHDQWRWLDPRYPELERTQDAFRRKIGRCPAFFRPPHGDRTPFLARVVRDHHMKMVLWNDSAHDWDEPDYRTIARRIVERAEPGSIILLHDGLDGDPTVNRSVLVRALPLILRGLRAKHLAVVGLDQLLGVPAWTPCG
jgi:peptidoglycan/xylan/chitin deacetylase (PgdA/CDA1 family)